MSRALPSFPSSNRPSTPPRPIASCFNDPNCSEAGVEPAAPVLTHNHNQDIQQLSDLPQPSRVIIPPQQPQPSSPKGPLDSTFSLREELDALDGDSEEEGDIEINLNLKELAETIRGLRKDRPRVYRKAKWRKKRHRKEEEPNGSAGTTSTAEAESLHRDQFQVQQKSAEAVEPPNTMTPMEVDSAVGPSTENDRNQTGKAKKRKRRMRNEFVPYNRESRAPPTDGLTPTIRVEKKARIARSFPSLDQAAELAPKFDPHAFPRGS
ncbi:hypothetical protein RUND412_008581 [Rhizina undulata]